MTIAYARPPLMPTIDLDEAWAAFERRDRAFDGSFVDESDPATTNRRRIALPTSPAVGFESFTATIHRIIEEVVPLPETESVVCGMSLGYADPDAPVNRLQTEREPVEAFARFHGF